jgi:hypothetical protein
MPKVISQADKNYSGGSKLSLYNSFSISYPPFSMIYLYELQENPNLSTSGLSSDLSII